MRAASIRKAVRATVGNAASQPNAVGRRDRRWKPAKALTLNAPNGPSRWQAARAARPHKRPHNFQTLKQNRSETPPEIRQRPKGHHRSHNLQTILHPRQGRQARTIPLRQCSHRRRSRRNRRRLYPARKKTPRQTYPEIRRRHVNRHDPNRLPTSTRRYYLLPRTILLSRPHRGFAMCRPLRAAPGAVLIGPLNGDEDQRRRPSKHQEAVCGLERRQEPPLFA